MATESNTSIKGNTTIINMDNVDHPKHYLGNVEVIDYINDKLTNEQFEGYLTGNIIKYISRYQKKNGVEDLKKARWYLNKLIEIKDNKD